MKNKGLFFVIGLFVVVLAVTGIFTISKNQDNKSTFASDGYIISVDDKEVIEKEVNEQHYFKAGETYKVKYPEKITFKDTKGKEVISDKAMFVHYLDSSISAFTKGVIINLDDKNAKDQYYSIGENVPLYYGNDGYQMNYMSEKMNMSNFIWKISDTDFMLVSDQIKLQLTDEVTVDIPQYIQMKYIDNVVRIVNQEGTYQTISDDATATLSNGVVLHLTDKELYDGEESFADLNSMIIDAESNMVIEEAEEPDIASYIPKFNVIDGQNGSQGKEGSSGDDGDDGQSGNKGNDGYDGSGGSTGKKGGSGSSGASGENGASGSTGSTGYDGIHSTAGEDGEKGKSGEDGESPETANQEVIVEPSVAVESFEIGLNSLKAVFRISDEDSRLEGQMTASIFKRNNMESVYSHLITAGQTTYNLNTNVLAPNTEYVLIVSGSYRSFDGTLQKDFLSKVFKTDSMGVTYSKKVASQDSLTFEVKVDDSTKVASALLQLKDKDGVEVGNEIVNVAAAVTNAQSEGKSQAKIEVTFDGLNADTEYEAGLNNITLLDTTLVDSLLPIKAYTLKTKPSIETVKPAISTNRRSGEIIAELTGVQDVNHGVTAYRYELYAASDITPEVVAGTISVQAEPVAVIQADKQGSQSFKTNGVTIKNNTYYYVRVVAKFSDNEKEAEYASQFSDAIRVDGSEFPSVVFAYEEDYCTWERIKGAVRINDAKDVVKVSADYPITILLTSALSDPKTYTVQADDLVTNSDGTFSVPFDFNSLKTEEAYTLSIYGFVDLDGKWDDLHDTEKAACRCLLGSSYKKTTSPDYLVVNDENNQLSSQAVFSQKIWLTGNAYEAGTLTSMTLELYDAYPQAGDEPIATSVVTDKNSAFYDSTIKDSYYEEDATEAVTKFMIVEPATFGFTDNQMMMDATYYIKVSEGKDYTSYPNNLPFRKLKEDGEGLEEAIIPIKLQTKHMIPSDVNDAVTVKPIMNFDAEQYNGSYDTSLEDNTVVGISVKAKYSLEDVQKVTYYAYTCKKEIPEGVDIVTSNKDEYLGESTSHSIVCKDENSMSKAGVKEWVIFFDDSDSDLFVRGQRYIFSYMLDTDGTIDCYQQGDEHRKHQYPACVFADREPGAVPMLRSNCLTVERQIPGVEAYLYTTDYRDSKAYVSWKYRLNDPDLAMQNSKLTIDKASVGAGALDAEDTNKNINEFRLFEYKLDGLTSDDTTYTLKGNYELCEGDDAVEKEYYTSKYQKVISDKTVDAEVVEINDIGGNRVEIVLKGTGTDDIAALRVTVTDCADTSNKKVISPVLLSNREEFEDGTVKVCGYVEFKDMLNLINKDVTFKIEGYYDTNRSGFKHSDDEFYALQTMDDELSYKKVTINSENDVALVSNLEKVLNNSIFKVYNFNPELPANRVGYHLGLLNLTHYAEGESLEPYAMNMVYDDNTGLLKEKTENVYYAMKRLGVSDSIHLDASLDTEFRFKDSLPSISKVKASAGLSSSTLEMEIRDLPSGANQTLYAQLFRIENGTRVPQKIIYKTVNLDDETSYETYQIDETQAEDTTNGIAINSNKSYSINFSNLKDNERYAVKFYMLGRSGNKIFLYDYTEKTTGVEYQFKTTTNIQLMNNGVEYRYNGYNDKSIVFNLMIPGNVSDGTGMLVYYTIKAEDGTEVVRKTLVNRKGDTIKYYSPLGNAFSTSFNPGEDIKPNQKYTVDMKAYSELDSGEADTELIGQGSFNFTTPKFIAPSFYVQGTSGAESTSEGVSLPTMNFKLVENDTNRVVVNDAYMVHFYDRKGNQIQTVYDDILYTESTKNFELNHETVQGTELDFSTTYFMTVFTMINLENKATIPVISQEQIEDKSKYLYTVQTSATTQDNYGIDVGNRSYSIDSDNYATVYFNNSSGLDKIEQITYSVYRQDGEAITPVYNTSENAAFVENEAGYSKKLSYEFAAGTYYLIMQFYNEEGTLVQQFNNDVITVK